VHLDFDTAGAAETLYVVLGSMGEEALDRKTISLDCDTIYFFDVLGDFGKTPEVNTTPLLHGTSLLCFEKEKE
jgi:hypothetical protein